MNTCQRSGKIAYPSAAAAWKVIRVRNNARSRFSHKTRGVTGQTYRCPDCGAWHIARSKPPGLRRPRGASAGDFFYD